MKRGVKLTPLFFPLSAQTKQISIMEKFNLKKAVEDVAKHTGRPVDLANRRDIALLEGVIERHFADVVRKLALIEGALASKEVDSFYNSKTEYIRRRHND